MRLLQELQSSDLNILPMLSSPSSSSFFYLPWRKPSSTQSECRDDDRDPLSRRTRNGAQTNNSLWSVKARQDLIDARRQAPLGRLFASSSTVDMFVANSSRPSPRNTHHKAYSTVGAVSTSDNHSHTQIRPSPEHIPKQRNQLHDMATTETYGSVQEKLLASLFSKQHKSYRRKNRELQYRSSATVCDPADIREREWIDQFDLPLKSQQQKKHIFPHSEYHDDRYGSNGQQRIAKYDTTAEEVDDGLNEWGLPKMLVTTRYEDEPEEIEGEDLDSNFGSSSEDSFAESTRSVTFQQILKKYTRPKYSNSNATMVEPSPAKSTKHKSNGESRVLYGTLKSFLVLTYTLCMACPAARSRCREYLEAFLKHPAVRAEVIARIVAVSYSIGTSPKRISIKPVAPKSGHTSSISPASSRTSKRSLKAHTNPDPIVIAKTTWEKPGVIPSVNYSERKTELSRPIDTSYKRLSNRSAKQLKNESSSSTPRPSRFVRSESANAPLNEFTSWGF